MRATHPASGASSPGPRSTRSPSSAKPSGISPTSRVVGTGSVRFKTSTGRLYSGGVVLVTDQLGLTRDRITTKTTATITLNAGGTRYTFKVPVGE